MTKRWLENGLYAGAFLLAVGVFLPFTRMAVIGNVSYHQMAEFEAYLVIACAAAGIVLSFVKLSKLVPFTVLGVWVAIFLPWLQQLINAQDKSLLGQLSYQANAAMNDFAKSILWNIDAYQWGGFVFLTGLALFTALGLFIGLKSK